MGRGRKWNEDKKQEYVESIYYKFHDVLESLYGIDYSHRNIRVVDSSGIIEKPSGQVYKTSFHVIFNEVHFANIDKMKIFIDKYFPELLQFTGVDGVVYKHDQLIRLPLCTKQGRNVPLLFVGDNEDDFQSCMVSSISSTSVWQAVDAKVIRKQVSVAPVDPEQMYKLEKLFIQHMDAFQWHSEEYSKWIEMGIRMYRAGFHYQTFVEFSKQSLKFN